VPAVDGAVYAPVAVTLPPPASCTAQVTAVFVAFVTVALSATVAPCCTLALDGVTETATAGGVTWIFDEPFPRPLFSALVSELVELAEVTESVELDELATTR
jgi:hypothetical protein